MESWEIHVAASTRHGYDIQTAGGETLIAYNLQNLPHAKMMAAAPDLYQALEALASAATLEGPPTYRWQHLLRKAREALVKAGKESIDADP